MTDSQDTDPPAEPPANEVRMFVGAVDVAIVQPGQSFSLYDSTDANRNESGWEAKEPVFMLRVRGTEGRGDHAAVEATLCWTLSHLAIALGNLIRVAGQYDLDDELLGGAMRVITGHGLLDENEDANEPSTPVQPDLTVCVWGRYGFVNVRDERVVAGTTPCEREPSSLLAGHDGTIAGAVCTDHAAALREHEVFDAPRLFPHNELRRPPTTTPGSEAALREGCRCPVAANEHGKGGPDGVYVVSDVCPVHAPQDTP